MCIPKDLRDSVKRVHNFQKISTRKDSESVQAKVAHRNNEKNNVTGNKSSLKNAVPSKLIE